jgi:L-alanine-DL-glutamate epimerase-like enolase superfamily enzyme
MILRYRPYTLELNHAFTIATSSRTSTPAMLVEVERDGVIGYGEAAMPPYLGESQETATRFFQRVDLSQFPDPFCLEDILPAIDALARATPRPKPRSTSPSTTGSAAASRRPGTVSGA